MVRDPNITKYFLVIVNSLLPLSWDPGQASSLITRLFLYLDLFSHLQDASIAIILLQLVNKPFFSSKPPPTLGSIENL